MHPNSQTLMANLVGKFVVTNEKLNVLDVGSADVNGSYKDIFTIRDWYYCGADIKAGNNVDFVMPDEYTLPEDREWDLVITGQCLEHVKHPWQLMAEIGRVCKPGGVVIAIAPWQWKIHRHPIDCWRVLPDGMKILLSEFAKCDVVAVGISQNDCYGVGVKCQTTRE